MFIFYSSGISLINVIFINLYCHLKCFIHYFLHKIILFIIQGNMLNINLYLSLTLYYVSNFMFYHFERNENKTYCFI